MTTRYDRMRQAASFLECTKSATGIMLCDQLRAEIGELEAVERDARNYAFSHADAAFDDLADRIRGEK